MHYTFRIFRPLQINPARMVFSIPFRVGSRWEFVNLVKWVQKWVQCGFDPLLSGNKRTINISNLSGLSRERVGGRNRLCCPCVEGKREDTNKIPKRIGKRPDRESRDNPVKQLFMCFLVYSSALICLNPTLRKGCKVFNGPEATLDPIMT